MKLKRKEKDATALRDHATNPPHKNLRGRPTMDKSMLPRKPERRRDYRLLYETLTHIRDNYVMHNHELYNHVTGILSIVVIPDRFAMSS